MFRANGEVVKLQTRVAGYASATSTELDADTFAKMYPFLPSTSTW
ncbi:MAG: hypothetical protein M5T61_19735 [Acidimicrobiia bacterium]|nr:hypothetical protein [Acidimicrobiia bacterium]